MANSYLGQLKPAVGGGLGGIPQRAAASAASGSSVKYAVDTGVTPTLIDVGNPVHLVSNTTDSITIDGFESVNGGIITYYDGSSTQQRAFTFDDSGLSLKSPLNNTSKDYYAHDVTSIGDKLVFGNPGGAPTLNYLSYSGGGTTSGTFCTVPTSGTLANTGETYSSLNWMPAISGYGPNQKPLPTHLDNGNLLYLGYSTVGAQVRLVGVEINAAGSVISVNNFAQLRLNGYTPDNNGAIVFNYSGKLVLVILEYSASQYYMHFRSFNINKSTYAVTNGTNLYTNVTFSGISTIYQWIAIPTKQNVIVSVCGYNGSTPYTVRSAGFSVASDGTIDLVAYSTSFQNDRSQFGNMNAASAFPAWNGPIIYMPRHNAFRSVSYSSAQHSGSIGAPANGAITDYYRTVMSVGKFNAIPLISYASAVSTATTTNNCLSASFTPIVRMAGNAMLDYGYATVFAMAYLRNGYHIVAFGNMGSDGSRYIYLQLLKEA